MDINPSDENLYTRRKEISDILKLYTAWLGGWEALEKGSLVSDCDNRYTARYFLRNLAQIKDANVDNLPVLTIHQLLEPDARQGLSLIHISEPTRLALI
eukprot:4977706-Alexandrium_andersonii.AAC.1